VARKEHTLELEIGARRLAALWPSPIPTRIAWHSSDIVLQTAA
jgi:hypothetical protein